jgi:DNA-directed RNA polymerase sigma subunit (sigma70/sigma32)
MYGLRDMKRRPIAQRLDTGLNKYLTEIGRIPLLTTEQEHAVATKASNGDKAARDQMIHSNLRLVVTIAQDYLNLGLPLSDLISEGTMGLAKAVEAIRSDERGQAQHLRCVVDQAIHQARAFQTGKDSSPPYSFTAENSESPSSLTGHGGRPRSRTDR